MKHKKDNCQAHHMIIADCCGLGCANCLICKCEVNVKDEIIKDIQIASLKIEAKHRYPSGLEIHERENIHGVPTNYLFFNSPDGQNGELYAELKNMGYCNAGYTAQYHWKIKKYNSNWYISYTEGDISVFKLTK